MQIRPRPSRLLAASNAQRNARLHSAGCCLGPQSSLNPAIGREREHSIFRTLRLADSGGAKSAPSGHSVSCFGLAAPGWPLSLQPPWNGSRGGVPVSLLWLGIQCMQHFANFVITVRDLKGTGKMSYGFSQAILVDQSQSEILMRRDEIGFELQGHRKLGDCLGHL